MFKYIPVEHAKASGHPSVVESVHVQARLRHLQRAHRDNQVLYEVSRLCFLLYIDISASFIPK